VDLTTTLGKLIGLMTEFSPVDNGAVQI